MSKPTLQSLSAHDVLHLSNLSPAAQPEPLYLPVRAPAESAGSEPQLLFRARDLEEPESGTHPQTHQRGRGDAALVGATAIRGNHSGNGLS